MTTPDLPKTMLAGQLKDFNQPYKIHSVGLPKSLGPFDVLIKVAVASYCHTDFMVSRGQFPTKLPCIASHEGSGTVVRLGSKVTALKVGDRAMADIPANRCQECDDCRGPEVYRQYCQHIDGYVGVTIDGAFAEYMRADSRESCVIPDGVSFETAAPLACAGCTIYRALLQTGLRAGMTVGIVGAGGGLGHIGIQMGKAMGLRVVGVDARDEALKLAKECGADVVIDVRKKKEEIVNEVHEVTGGKGVDASITISDHQTAAALACAITVMHGTMVQIAQVLGIPTICCGSALTSSRIAGAGLHPFP